MNTYRAILFAGLLITADSGSAEPGHTVLQILPANETAQIFSGAQRSVPVLVSNTTDHLVAADLRMRRYQATSATAALDSEQPWKRLSLLPGQTLLESVTLELADVRSETLFLVRFLEGTNTLMGTLSVRVFPTNLLNELRLLADNLPIAVFDPQNQIKPALKNQTIEILDLEAADFFGFGGKLAVIGPFISSKYRTGEITSRIKKLAANGAGVVWIQPPPEPWDPPQPSFYCRSEGAGQLVIVEASMVADLDHLPQSQLSLIHLCRMAVRPEPLRLPVALR